MFDNLQSTMNTFSVALYFLQVEIMTNLDHYNSIVGEQGEPAQVAQEWKQGQGKSTGDIT